MNQRAEIKELLINDYWKKEADSIIDAALKAGFTLDEIAWTVVHSGTDALILYTYWRTLAENA